jgi:hypothetical protein
MARVEDFRVDADASNGAAAQIEYGDITDEELAASAARVFEMLDKEEDAAARLLGAQFYAYLSSVAGVSFTPPNAIRDSRIASI